MVLSKKQKQKHKTNPFSNPFSYPRAANLALSTKYHGLPSPSLPLLDNLILSHLHLPETKEFSFCIFFAAVRVHSIYPFEPAKKNVYSFPPAFLV